MIQSSTQCTTPNTLTGYEPKSSLNRITLPPEDALPRTVLNNLQADARSASNSASGGTKLDTAELILMKVIFADQVVHLGRMGGYIGARQTFEFETVLNAGCGV